MTTFCPHNCLNPPWHTFYEVLTCFWWNVFPLCPTIHAPLGWSFILMKLVFEVFPKMFNGIEIGLARILLEYIVFKPLVGLLKGVFWIIVLLKVTLSLLHLQCLKAFHQTILYNFTIFCSIHLPLNLYQLPHPIPPHTTLYHEVIPASMLYCWSSCSVRYWFSSLLPYMHLFIRPNLIYLCFIWPWNTFEVLYSPVFMIVCKL